MKVSHLCYSRCGAGAGRGHPRWISWNSAAQTSESRGNEATWLIINTILCWLHRDHGCSESPIKWLLWCFQMCKFSEKVSEEEVTKTWGLISWFSRCRLFTRTDTKPSRMYLRLNSSVTIVFKKKVLKSGKCMVNHDHKTDLSWVLPHKLRKLVGLTDRRSSGRFPPLLMPLFMEMKRSSVVLSFTQGLWRLVLSMMMANDRM